jgi:hypothetical protein
MSERTTIDDLPAAGRTRLQRLSPSETFAAVRDGAVLIRAGRRSMSRPGVRA